MLIAFPFLDIILQINNVLTYFFRNEAPPHLSARANFDMLFANIYTFSPRRRCLDPLHAHQQRLDLQLNGIKGRSVNEISKCVRSVLLPRCHQDGVGAPPFRPGDKGASPCHQDRVGAPHPVLVTIKWRGTLGNTPPGSPPTSW